MKSKEYQYSNCFEMVEPTILDQILLLDMIKNLIKYPPILSLCY